MTDEKNMHADDIGEWLRVLECQHLVLIHLSRRTNLADARKAIAAVAGKEKVEKIQLLMDHRSNRERYERQEVELGGGGAPADAE